MNCRSHPEAALYPATDLLTVAGRDIAPETVLEALAAEMAQRTDIWSQGAGFATIRAEWLALAAGVGGRIRVVRPTETLEGVFETIDAAGRLILQQDSGERIVDAGDVFWLRRRRAPTYKSR